MNCEGSCEDRDGHSGDAVRVRVRLPRKYWGEFWYCQAAIEEDRKRGFTVEVDPPQSGEANRENE